MNNLDLLKFNFAESVLKVAYKKVKQILCFLFIKPSPVPKVYSIFLLMIFLFYGKLYSAIIWSEDFASYNDDSGYIGPGNQTTGDYPSLVTKWTLDVSSASLTADSDWFMVNNVSGNNLFEGRDLDGEAIWQSESINISSYTNVKFQLDATESGTMEPDDYFDVEYQINGGSWVLITNWNGKGTASHTLHDDFTSETVIQSNLNGTTLKLRIKMNNNAGSEYLRLDNIIVSGTLKSGGGTSHSITASINKDIEEYNLYVTYTNQSVLSFKVTGSSNSHYLKKIKITNIAAGTRADNTDLPVVRLWIDNNTNKWWDGADTGGWILGYAGNYTWTNNNLPSSATMGTNGTYYIITVNISSSANDGRSVRFKIPQGGLWCSAATPTSNSSAISNSSTQYIKSPAPEKRILFDASLDEMTGNADWVIDADKHDYFRNGSFTGNESDPQRYPTPHNPTGETSWAGANSKMAYICFTNNWSVETLPIKGRITYGDSTNPQDLSHYDLFIIDEPQDQLTTAEKQAILSFVSNGGALFMISDHTNSDRDFDGWDSPRIFNDMGAPSKFGIKFYDWVATNGLASTQVIVSSSPSDPVVHGPFGDVTYITNVDACKIEIFPSSNSTVKAHIWMSNQDNQHVMLATAKYGSGRVAALNDSSPADDGTGDPNDSLYNNWDDGQSGIAIMNTIHWLLYGDLHNFEVSQRTNLPDKNVYRYQTNVSVLSIKVSDNSNHNLDVIKISNSATGSKMVYNSDFNSIKVWLDNGSIPHYWDSGDTYITSLSQQGNYFYASNIGQQLSANGTNIIITINILGTATNGRRFKGYIPPNSWRCSGGGYAPPSQIENSGTLTIVSKTVVFEEINWAGSDKTFADEWIVLYNSTSSNILLDGWVWSDNNSSYTLSGIIPANGSYLIEADNDTRVANVIADAIFSFDLSNGGENLRLYNSNGNLVDTVSCSNGWYAGSNSPKYSMSRKSVEGPDNASNWSNTIPNNGALDSGGNLYQHATPVNAGFIDKITSHIGNLVYTAGTVNKVVLCFNARSEFTNNRFLTGIKAGNLGTAQWSSDITNIKLWIDRGTKYQYDGSDIFVCNLTPSGSYYQFSGVTTATLGKYGGEDFILTVDIKADATIGRTLRFYIPPLGLTATGGSNGAVWGITNNGTQTIGSPPSADSNIIINEIMYDPENNTPERDWEWIELYNRGNITVNISSWTLYDPSPSTGEGGFGFPDNTEIGPGEYLIICANRDWFKSHYTNTYCEILTWPSIVLGNSGDQLILKNGSGEIIQNIDYPDKASDGDSLERIDPFSSETDSSNWDDSENTDFGAQHAANNGTPGKTNSVMSATGSLPADNHAPYKIFRAWGWEGANEIYVEFPESVSTNVFNPAYWTVSGGLSVYSVEYDPYDKTKHTVKLTITGGVLPDHTQSITVCVINAEDLYGNVNTAQLCYTFNPDAVTEGPDISHWTLYQLRNQANGTQTFVFPPGTFVPSGGYLIVGFNSFEQDFKDGWGITSWTNPTVYYNTRGTFYIPGSTPGVFFKLVSDDSSYTDGPTYPEITDSQRTYRKGTEYDAGASSSWVTSSDPDNATPGSGVTNATYTNNVVIMEYSGGKGGNDAIEFVELFCDQDVAPPINAYLYISTNLNVRTNVPFTTSRTVVLITHATDTMSGVTNMRFANENTNNWSSWVPYSTNYSPWVITNGSDGVKTVWCEYQDKAGNIRRVVDTIILDRYPPYNCSITINNGDEYCNNTNLRLTLSATDDGTGVQEMRFSVDDTNSWGPWVPYSTSYTLAISTNQGKRTVYVQFRDAVPWVTTSVISDTIILDTTPPEIIFNYPANPGDVIGPFVVDPGNIIDIDFTNAGAPQRAPMDEAEYQIESTGWSDIFTNNLMNSYISNWAISWTNTSLGTNAISIRVWDLAGNTNTQIYSPGSSGFGFWRSTGIVVDGDDSDWPGTPGTNINSAVVSGGVWIWTDNTNDYRNDTGGGDNLDIKEIRITSQRNNLFFLVKVKNMTDQNRVHFAISLDLDRNSTDTNKNWMGDDSGTTVGTNKQYWERQIVFHCSTTGGEVVELYADYSNSWYGDPTKYKIVMSNNNALIEASISNSYLGISSLPTNIRVTIGMFDNWVGWNNNGDQTRNMGTCDLADAMTPGMLNTWYAEAVDADVDFYADISFRTNGTVENNNPPSTPHILYPSTNASINENSPTFKWNSSTDPDGDTITFYHIQVSTNSNNFVEGIIINGNDTSEGIKRIEDTPMTNWNLPGSISLENGKKYYWRVRAYDEHGQASPWSSIIPFSVVAFRRTVDGDPSDWKGVAGNKINSSVVSSNEWIWRDKTGDSRFGTPGTDLKELRMIADQNYLYFMLRYSNINSGNIPMFSVAIDTDHNPSDTGLNWIGDQAGVTLGNSEQYAEVIVEFFSNYAYYYTETGGSWQLSSGPASYRCQVGISSNCLEAMIPWSDLGISLTTTKTLYMSFATFEHETANNDPGVNDCTKDHTDNDADDVLAPPYKNSWEAELSDNDIDYYFHIVFDTNGNVATNNEEAKPELVSPADGGQAPNDPTLVWNKVIPEAGDQIVYYHVQVSSNNTFTQLFYNLEITTTNTNYHIDANNFIEGLTYYWRVRAYDEHGTASDWSNRSFVVGIFRRNVDGDPSDWKGIPPVDVDSWIISSNEWIWRDDINDQRNNAVSVSNSDMDILEVRIIGDTNAYVETKGNIFFMIKFRTMEGLYSENINIAIDTNINVDGSLNWIGDDAEMTIEESKAYADYNLNWCYDGWNDMYIYDQVNDWHRPVSYKSYIGVSSNIYEGRISMNSFGLDMKTGPVIRLMIGVGEYSNSGDPKIAQKNREKFGSDFLDAVNPGTGSAWYDEISDGKMDYWFIIKFNNRGDVVGATAKGMNDEDTIKTNYPRIKIVEVSPNNESRTDYIRLYCIDDGMGGNGTTLTNYRITDYDGDVIKRIDGGTIKSGEEILLKFNSTAADETTATGGVLHIYTTNKNSRLESADEVALIIPYTNDGVMSIMDAVAWKSNTTLPADISELTNAGEWIDGTSSGLLEWGDLAQIDYSAFIRRTNGGIYIDNNIKGDWTNIHYETTLEIVKSISNITGLTGEPIPGSEITYEIRYSNTGNYGAYNVILYDRIPWGYVEYKSNSAGGTAAGWTVEWSTNSSPDQSWESTDYTSTEPPSSQIKWIRWKKYYVAPGEGIGGNNVLKFKVIIK